MENTQMKGKFLHGNSQPSTTLHTTEVARTTTSTTPSGNDYYTLLLERKAVLNATNEQLKATFIGLDSIIDELMGLVSSWYLFPEAQLRPMVINLWGLTGSGKTALVKQLVQLLEFNKRYIQIDMGEFESDSATWFRKTLTSDMEYLNEQPCMLCLDEFQFARTLDNQGNELGKDKLRFVWDLVDSGKLSYSPPANAYYQKRAEECLNLLLRSQMAGVLINKGVVVEKTEEFLHIFEGFYFETYGRGGAALDVNYFLSEDFCSGVYYLAHDNETFEDSVKDDVTKSDLEGIISIVLRSLETRNTTCELDLSKSLIFVLGNLDEAYNMSRSMNPDVSADELHEATLRISITNIKSALKNRFRPEQIARLGNNHLIYRAFRNADFEELIRRELQRVAGFIQQEFGVTFEFHESIHRLIYQEGVFPAQGTRPVLTTIKNYVEAWFGRIVLRIIEQQLDVSTVEWSYAQGAYRFVFKNAEGAVVAMGEEPILLKIEPLRKTTRELQAHTAVHEAGHAVLAVLTLRILPSVIVSKSAADYAEGFCMINMPEGLTTRETLRKDIVISLGGFVAERMIFGEENTSSGVNGDIQEATRLANEAIRQYAMGSDPIYLEAESSGSNDVFYMQDKYRDEALQLIRTCEAEAMCLLERNKLLLLKIAEYLTDHYKMEESTIAEYVQQYGKESWMQTADFLKKDYYFTFEKSIREQLQQLENEQTNP